MYKVFHISKSLILDDKPHKNCQNYSFEEINNERILEWWLEKDEKNICLFSSHLKPLWRKFCLDFKILEAAGGLTTFKKQWLAIYRLNKWDLPKGKIEKDESPEQAAIREVEEECGVSGLVLEEKITVTYHIYSAKNSWILKPTHWYKMKAKSLQKLIPQAEEGIAKAEWKNLSDLKKIKENTYPNIELVLNEVFS